jgi:sugar O-acyltransferase (sialic acid O-acetyltransferase NeuD family)
MKNDAVIIGYSGHAFVVLDILKANGYINISYCERFEKDYNPFSLPYLGDERVIDTMAWKNNNDVFIGIGDNYLRANCFDYLKNNSAILPSIKHPTSTISPSVSIANGSVIMQGVVINALSNIGFAVICNTACVIEHECIIGNYVHIAPGSVIAGNVTIGDYTFIGANSVIKQGVSIGNNVTIGAGSVVINDIKDGSIVYGNPAKSKKS